MRRICLLFFLGSILLEPSTAMANKCKEEVSRLKTKRKLKTNKEPSVSQSVEALSGFKKSLAEHYLEKTIIKFSKNQSSESKPLIEKFTRKYRQQIEEAPLGFDEFVERSYEFLLKDQLYWLEYKRKILEAQDKARRQSPGQEFAHFSVTPPNLMNVMNAFRSDVEKIREETKAQTKDQTYELLKERLVRRVKKARDLALKISRPENLAVQIYRWEGLSMIQKRGYLANWASNSHSDFAFRTSYQDVQSFSQGVLGDHFQQSDFERWPATLYPKHAYLTFKKLPDGVLLESPYHGHKEDVPILQAPFHYQIDFKSIQDRSLYCLGDAIAQLSSYESRLESWLGRYFDADNKYLSPPEWPNISMLPSEAFRPLDQLHLVFYQVFSSLVENDNKKIKMPNGEVIEVLVFGKITEEDLKEVPRPTD